MAENSPRSPDRKLGLIAPLSIAAAIALVLIIAVLMKPRAAPEPKVAPPPTPAPSAPAAAPAAAPAPIAAPDPPLSRTEILKETNAIAAAYAANGVETASGKDPLIGRRFAVRIPFGCEGPQARPGVAQAYYDFNAQKRTVRLVARPAVWSTLPLIQELPKRDQLEAVEGFWIPHPWSFADVCPPPRQKPVPASPTPVAAPTLGLARLYEVGASRVGRRADRPYEQVIKLADGEALPLAQGYRLVLEGRFAAYPDARVAHCWSESPAHRPVCLYAVEFDRVAFEAGQDGKLLAEWRE